MAICDTSSSDPENLREKLNKDRTHNDSFVSNGSQLHLIENIYLNYCDTGIIYQTRVLM
jgi:hypothetical protein